MNCPNCGTYNEPNNKFCLRCGTPLKTDALTPPPTQPMASSTLPSNPFSAPASPPSTTWASSEQPGYQSAYQSRSPATYSSSPDYPFQQPYSTLGLELFNIWGPFAGYGTRRRHVGWLMNNQGLRKGDLINRVEKKFKEREIPGAYIFKPTLTARGVLVESRPYFVLRRGLVSLALYIGQFGRDLFISLASYLKPPISTFRMLIAGAMLLFQSFMTFIYPAAVNSAFTAMTQSFNLFGGGELNTGPLLFLLCIVGPLGGLNSLALFLLFCFSVYKWLTEKDFFAALRVPPNEFNEDDLMAMEKAVEETVRQSLTDIQLNPDDLQATSTTGARLF